MQTIRALSAAGLVLALAACDTGSSQSDPRATPSPTGSAPTSTAIPAGFTECRTLVQAYVVSYPEDWYTASTTGANECRWFDREPLTLDEGSEPPPVDVEVIREQNQSFEEAVADLGGEDSGEEAGSTRETQVGDWRAVEFELIATGDTAYPEGTRTYGFLLDVQGRAFRVITIDAAGGMGSYEENQDAVAEIAATIRPLE